MATVPAYGAVRSGPLGDPGAVNASAGVNQLLGAHPSIEVYTGSEILTPAGAGGSPLSVNLGLADWAQPFTMSGTAIGRVVVPVAPVGAGADLTVTLCTDSGGSPGTVITSTRVAAKALAALVATATLAAGSAGPLQTAASNAVTGGAGVFVPYPTPAVSVAGGGTNAGIVTSGSTILLVGGIDASHNAVASVFSIAYTGGTTLAAPVPQPSMPQALSLPGVATTPDTLVVASGTVPGSPATPSASVFTASLNSATGTVGAWSTQTSLPQALSQAVVAASGQNVYVIGGLNSATQPTSQVYRATVQNGQITGWSTTTAYPLTINATSAAVVNGFLVVADPILNQIVYAPVNADGSLGAWQFGPSIPHPVNAMATVPGCGIAMIAFDGPPAASYLETLAVGPNGPGPVVQVQSAMGSLGGSSLAVMPVGVGTWQLFSLFGTQYWTQQATLVPAVSIPLPASGLTNGTTYHVVLSQQGGDSADYLLTGTDQAVFPGNPTARSRARSGGSTWTATTPAGTAIPIQVWNRSAGGQVLHTWTDSGARHATLVWASTPDRRLLGIIEHTAQPGPVLNATPTFAGGTAPWTATGGTVTTLATFTRGQLPLSAALTPSGSAATAQIECEQQPVFQGHSYTATAWLYSNAGYGAAAVSINWYNASHVFLSTTAGASTALAAATWTQLATTGPVPAGAAYGTVVVAETGTPPASAVLYVSAAPLQDASGPMLPSIAQITYPGTWPAASWPPLAVTQLA